MHLGLIDSPFVAHNLISTQDSPVPLQKFQMTPRLKILMAPGPKGTQIYSSCPSKVPANNPLQVPQQGPYREGDSLTGHFAYLKNLIFRVPQ